MRKSIWLGVWMAVAAGGQCAAEPGTAAPSWSEINVIFAERCIMCHSDQAAAKGLRLDSYEGAVAGSERGPVLVSGDADHSELIRRLRGQSRPRMPFLSRPLPDDQIDLITRWIAAGMPQSSQTAAPAE